MIHQGYCLKVFIESGGAQVNEIASVLGISRQGVNGLYGQTSLDKTYIEKIRKADYKIPGITTDGGAEIGVSASDKKEIEMLREIIKTKDEIIGLLRGNK